MKHATLILRLFREGRMWCTRDGRVFTRVQDGPFSNSVHEKAQRPSHNGYLLMTVCRRSAAATVSAHSVIWLYFRGRVPAGLQINHKNGNKLDNSISNLEVVTPSQNIKHSFRLGLQKPTAGTTNGMSKLTDAKVLAIRKSKATPTVLAEQYGVSPAAIWMARTRRTWRHI